LHSHNVPRDGLNAFKINKSPCHYVNRTLFLGRPVLGVYAISTELYWGAYRNKRRVNNLDLSVDVSSPRRKEEWHTVGKSEVWQSSDMRGWH
jgi:hypothetical protein